MQFLNVVNLFIGYLSVRVPFSKDQKAGITRTLETNGMMQPNRINWALDLMPSYDGFPSSFGVRGLPRPILDTAF
jgi:hypothetical protein